MALWVGGIAQDYVAAAENWREQQYVKTERNKQNEAQERTLKEYPHSL